MKNKRLLKQDFYLRPDVVEIARDLLGKVLVTRFNDVETSGIITETEAYAGVTDKASHAFGGRKTRRTEIMFRKGGHAYIYLCYGIHSLFNVVTNVRGIPHAVLVRGVYPLEGEDVMLKRSGKSKIDKLFGSGPGKVAKILGLHFAHTGLPLVAEELKDAGPLQVWIEDRNYRVNGDEVKVTARIGVDYAQEDAGLPYRFLWIKKMPHVES